MTDESVIRALTRSALSHLVSQVMAEESLSLPDALKAVYESRLYEQINDSQTGLYREGPVYLYGLFREGLASREKRAW